MSHHGWVLLRESSTYEAYIIVVKVEAIMLLWRVKKGAEQRCPRLKKRIVIRALINIIRNYICLVLSTTWVCHPERSEGLQKS